MLTLVDRADEPEHIAVIRCSTGTHIKVVLSDTPMPDAKTVSIVDMNPPADGIYQHLLMLDREMIGRLRDLGTLDAFLHATALAAEELLD